MGLVSVKLWPAASGTGCLECQLVYGSILPAPCCETVPVGTGCINSRQRFIALFGKSVCALVGSGDGRTFLTAFGGKTGSESRDVFQTALRRLCIKKQRLSIARVWIPFQSAED